MAVMERFMMHSNKKGNAIECDDHRYSFVGCKSKDADIKRSIAVNAKEELMFAGVNYNVD